jgi:hypothetical protein
MRVASSLLSFVTIAAVFSGCASLTTPKSPDLFPNEKLNRTSRGQVSMDVNECMALADQYIQQPNKYVEMGKQGLIGGAVGAGTGALAGTIVGSNPGRSTGAGAAVGGILGVLNAAKDMNERTPSYERFVEHCLQKKGYEITGWSSK